MAESILVRESDGIGRIVIDRPEKKNAITTGMYASMADAIQAMASNDAVRVAVISGQQDFTAGNDLQDFMMASMAGANFEDLPVLRFLRALRDFPKPVIAAVRGNAVGIGTTLLLHTDVVVAGTTARFRLPFVQLGLVPEAASSLLLPYTVGRTRAAWLLMAGEFFNADEALAMGLVSKVVEDDRVDATSEEFAAKLAALPPTALRETKRLIRAPLADQVERVMEDEVSVFTERLKSDEFRAAAMKLLTR